MWDKIVDLAINNGIWAVMFLCLLIYQLKDSKLREQKYQETISSLSNSLQTIDYVKQDVNDIKNYLNINSKGENDEI